jgi:hypothetical protein
MLLALPLQLTDPELVRHKQKRQPDLTRRLRPSQTFGDRLSGPAVEDDDGEEDDDDDNKIDDDDEDEDDGEDDEDDENDEGEDKDRDEDTADDGERNGVQCAGDADEKLASDNLVTRLAQGRWIGGLDAGNGQQARQFAEPPARPSSTSDKDQYELDDDDDGVIQTGRARGDGSINRPATEWNDGQHRRRLPHRRRRRQRQQQDRSSDDGSLRSPAGASRLEQSSQTELAEVVDAASYDDDQQQRAADRAAGGPLDGEDLDMNDDEGRGPVPSAERRPDYEIGLLGSLVAKTMDEFDRLEGLMGGSAETGDNRARVGVVLAGELEAKRAANRTPAGGT